VTHKHAVVVGGGMLRLVEVNGLLSRGMNVTLVEIAP
jgi:NAD(P)H-nitrite reductase large subunit